MTIELIHSEPPPELEQRILRLRNDALFLKTVMTKAQSRFAYIILERVRDDLSAVLDRAENKK